MVLTLFQHGTVLCYGPCSYECTYVCGRLYASAPSYPHGAIDPVREMGKFAKQKGIGLHVDCCLGGFVLPFARKLDASNIPGPYPRHSYFILFYFILLFECTS